QRARHLGGAVAPGLGDLEAHRLTIVEQRQRALLLRSIPHRGHVAEPDELAVALRDHQALEVRRTAEAPLQPYGALVQRTPRPPAARRRRARRAPPTPVWSARPPPPPPVPPAPQGSAAAAPAPPPKRWSPSPRETPGQVPPLAPVPACPPRSPGPRPERSAA